MAVTKRAPPPARSAAGARPPGPKAPVKKAGVPKPAGGKEARRGSRQSREIEMQVYFGRRVRELREAAGLSQLALAERLGVPAPRLPAIEHGRHDVRLSTLRRFARALGVTVSDLLPPD